MEKRPLDHSDVEPPSKRLRQDGPFPDEHVDTPHPSEKPNSDRSICNNCRSVDWSSLPTLVGDGLKTKYLDLRPVNATRAELGSSTCRICAILSTIKEPLYDGKRCVLTALRLSDQSNYRMSWSSHRGRASQCASLCIMEGQKSSPKRYCFERGLAIVRIDDLEARELRPSSVDYSKFRELMKICEEKHKTCCAIESRTINILGLKVIDTKTQRVIKAPDDCEYVALSYVWGKDGSEGSSSAYDIRTSPAVIRDAISVTNSMGYSYLWVDRYCISDSKEEEKSRMIKKMDQIYANAAFTIVAAADGDTELGLCGVSMLRQPRHVIIQDVALLELPFPAEHLTASKWATRAWTYQEGYLSRRRLIFTKSQVVFLCNGMYATESFQSLLSSPCFFDHTVGFHHLIPTFKAMRRRFSATDLLGQVEVYSKRELTRSSDSLNAILGVLNYFSRASANLKSPVLQLPWGLIANKHAKKDSFGLHFWWRHNAEQLPTRRPEFPSWSWTGWGGLLTFFEDEIILQPKHLVQEGPLSYIDWKLSMRDDGGNDLEIYDLACEEFAARRSTRELYRPDPKQLQVTCLVVPVSFQELNFTEDQRRHGTSISVRDTEELFSRDCDVLPHGTCSILQIWKGIYLGYGREDMALDQKVEEHDRILGLLFACRKEKHDYNDFHCLLARDAGGEFYERVGALNMGDITYLSSAYRRAYLDAKGSLLDHFAISETQRTHPFDETAERRTMCLV